MDSGAETLNRRLNNPPSEIRNASEYPPHHNTTTLERMEKRGKGG
jgi:hypothetical protein